MKETMPHEERIYKPLFRDSWKLVKSCKLPHEHLWQTLDRIVRAGANLEISKNQDLTA